MLLRETLGFFEPLADGWMVDCTLGLGGHTEALLAANPGLCVLGVDRDRQALAKARTRLAPFGDRVRFAQGEFDDIGDHLEGAGLERAVGVLADLGVSSMQLDTPDRGFSFRFDGPLDMRMGDSTVTAREIVNRYPEAELERIFREYGEERQARRVARALVRERAERELETTRDLQQAVERAKRPERRRHGLARRDPATQVFQALRIEVNRELAGLEHLMSRVADSLESDGRLVVISYHSLEDRIVKNSLRNLARGEIDEVTGRTRSETRVLEVLTKKPVRPSEDEVAVNPRARSARLRAARRL